MKVFALTIIATLLLSLSAFSQNASTVQLRLGQQKFVSNGKLTVRFLSLVEDSRCPINAHCIWAGNAKIRLSVAKGRASARTIELNTGMEPQVVSIYGHDFKLEALAPHPGERQRRKTATIAISKAKI